MNKEDKEIIVGLIRKHQKQLRSLSSILGKKEDVLESCILDRNDHMVEWMHREVFRTFSEFRAQREIIRELTDLAGLDRTEFAHDIFIGDEAQRIGKILIVDERLPSIRDLITRRA